MTLLTSFSDNGNIDDALTLRPENILWKGGTAPESRCNARCPPGFRKVPTESIHVCCYNCAPCSEGEVSNITDSESCLKCPVKEWPDMKKMNCVSKIYEYLSYDNNIMILIFLFASVMLLAMTLFVLGNFIYYWDTPIVKANNRTVSFILLTSNFLSFLCVFLFLGHPVDITCMLRQVSFGVFFSIAVSSVLAKTVTVCIAFKASKPGSYWRKWATVKVSNSLVLICSSVQVLICFIWLSVSPPYQEFDIHSFPGKIIIQCNEGSVIGFYSMLGYMGFLAAVSFLLAFMVRTLPDSFNEAKYITFSTLVFCSVWIAMIPAYLSTRGKYMVAVEIFAILSSSAGILGCIFFPKCYIMLFKPELNTRKDICILSGEKIKAPNYSCREHGEVAGFIGDTSVQSNYAMAQLLSLYRYTHAPFLTGPVITPNRNLQQVFTVSSNTLLQLLGQQVDFLSFSTSQSNTGVVPTGKPFHSTLAVHVLSDALRMMYSRESASRNHRVTEVLHKYVGSLQKKTPFTKNIFFNENEEDLTKIFIANWVIHKSGTSYVHNVKLLTSFSDNGDIEDVLNFRPENITWKEGMVLLN
ncbi:vomeronasal type-2 receptor 26-like [Hyperolius riggenbachi]|uniref:vomeronasal type-2 receptor 26-like n=1 Tax=Hyperolius riggenbachi TaxID=752182 RepID=UPI0035A30500